MIGHSQEMLLRDLRQHRPRDVGLADAEHHWRGMFRRYDGAKVKLIQQTDYPWNGDFAIEFQLPKPVQFALRLRIPA